MHSDNYNTDAANFKKCKSGLCSDNLSFPTILPKTVKYANAYVPFQETKTIFEPEESLYKGTIFAELYQPYKKGCDNYHGKR